MGLVFSFACDQTAEALNQPLGLPKRKGRTMSIIRLLIIRVIIGKQRRMHLRTLLAALKPKPF